MERNIQWYQLPEPDEEPVIYLLDLMLEESAGIYHRKMAEWQRSAQKEKEIYAKKMVIWAEEELKRGEPIENIDLALEEDEQKAAFRMRLERDTFQQQMIIEKTTRDAAMTAYCERSRNS